MRMQRKAVDLRRRCTNGEPGLCGCMTRDGGCMRCGSGLHCTVDERGICTSCQREELALEYVRRFEAWAVKLGSRRPLAEDLVREAEKCLPRRAYFSKRALAHFARWAFAWEMTGDRRELLKVVEELMPWWKQDRKTVVDPATVKPDDVGLTVESAA